MDSPLNFHWGEDAQYLDTIVHAVRLGECHCGSM